MYRYNIKMLGFDLAKRIEKDYYFYPNIVYRTLVILLLPLFMFFTFIFLFLMDFKFNLYLMSFIIFYTILSIVLFKLSFNYVSMANNILTVKTFFSKKEMDINEISCIIREVKLFYPYDPIPIYYKNRLVSFYL
ncbi:hypothetical protein, partial [Oceanivirga salmonicida]